MSTFSKSFQKTAFLTVFYDFVAQVNEQKWVFDNSLLIQNNLWNDVLVLYSTGSTGLMFGVVDDRNLRLDPVDNGGNYWNKKMWYKELNADQVNYITNNLPLPQDIYDYWFFKDKVFADMYIANIDLESYNWWSLIDMNIDILTRYTDDRRGTVLNELLPEDIFRVSLTF